MRPVWHLPQQSVRGAIAMPARLGPMRRDHVRADGGPVRGVAGSFRASSVKRDSTYLRFVTKLGRGFRWGRSPLIPRKAFSVASPLAVPRRGAEQIAAAVRRDEGRRWVRRHAAGDRTRSGVLEPID